MDSSQRLSVTSVGRMPELETQQLQGSAAASAINMKQPSSAERRTVGIVYDQAMEWHVREDHPEHPDRVKVLNECLVEAGLMERCVKLPSRMATDAELLTSHSQEHIDKVSHLYNNAPNMHTDEGELLKRIGDTFIITGDIYCNAHTNAAARSAAGCAIQAVESVITGEVDSAFAIVRPPGHHAEPSDYMGFCFFNNVAVAAHAVLKHPGIKRVLVLDWDIHHGNGTQKVFWKDDRVLFVSLHRRDKDFYPEGVGFATEVGEDAGRGFNVNVPWSEKGVGDADYMAAFELILEPIIREFDPQLVIISAGFDAADGDFLGKCHVSEQGFSAMTKMLMRHANGKVAAVLEGGYVPRLLGNCAASVLSTLLGDPSPSLPASVLAKLRKKTAAALASVHEQQRPFWKSLAAQKLFTDAYKAYKASQELAGLTIGRPTRHQAAAATAAAPAAAATGHICGAVCLTDGAAACGASLPLAARAPPLRSAAGGGRGRKPGTKAAPAAVAAAEAGADMAAAAAAAAAAASAAASLPAAVAAASIPQAQHLGAGAMQPSQQPSPSLSGSSPDAAAQAAAAPAPAAAATGHICGAMCLTDDAGASCGSGLPLAARAPPLRSAAAGRGRGKAAPAAAAAAVGAGQAGAEAPASPAASMPTAAAVLPEPGALSAPAAPAAVPMAGRKIRIKLGGKVIAAGGVRPPAAVLAEAPAAAPVEAAAAPAPAAATMAAAPAVVAASTAPLATPEASAGPLAAVIAAVTAAEETAAWLPATPATPAAAPSMLTNLTTPVSSHTRSHDRQVKTAAAAAAAVTPAGSVTPTPGHAVGAMLPLSPVADGSMQLPVGIVKQEPGALGPPAAPAATAAAPVTDTEMEDSDTAAAVAVPAAMPADVQGMGPKSPALPAAVAEASPDSLSALVAAVAAMSLPEDSPPPA